jgi:hypothetical protein
MRRLLPILTFAAIAVLATLAACACSDDNDVPQAPGETPAATSPYAGYHSAIYADPANWLCRPDIEDDFCDQDLDATAISADGTLDVEPFEAAADPPIDCFYIYPTVSVDEGANSDLIPDPGFEGTAVRSQFARLGSVCRLYAPVYQQMTLTALLSRLGGGGGASSTDSRTIAYESAREAWMQYMANDNDGRGVVLVGHSQGSFVLTQLIKNEIDGNPQLRGQLVSAVLLGTSLQVPAGADVGGDFKNIPLCRAAAQIGCVITYASFAADAPPPADSIFGRGGPGMQAGCTNPAALAGGRGTLRPYFPAQRRSSGGFDERAVVRQVDEPWVAGAEVTTPWVTLPDFIEAECVVRDGFSYLEITVLADPADPRTDDIGGDVALPSFGLHVIDASLSMGDIVDIVGRQAEAYVDAKG